MQDGFPYLIICKLVRLTLPKDQILVLSQQKNKERIFRQQFLYQ